uniref:Uncharacterized protein n=1 Tax=Opuntia streptacantha TaxID=393608 RepID=A0A7C9D9V6_OPUST
MPPSAPNLVTSPLTKDKGKTVLVEDDSLPGQFQPQGPILDPIPRTSIGNLSPVNGSLRVPPQQLPAPTYPSPVRSSTLRATHPFSPVSPLERLPSLPNDEADSSALFTTVMDHDGDDEIFMDLEDLIDPAISSESSKKRKLEDGDEASSHL